MAKRLASWKKKKLGGTIGELKRKTLKRNPKPKEVILILRSYDSKCFHGNWGKAVLRAALTDYRDFMTQKRQEIWNFKKEFNKEKGDWETLETSPLSI